ncbi:DNA methyltransferase [Candidatus Venteria ishoeyi]|uniref:site-specific DNA-methyltransferase (cytosine-N(4)-specific) n=1 Tax=Candidatus Venteria ishoeyi TaxID=1899563 RepID=A0A1H6FCL1_9GAMM|nr:DNA methyltransferase [Candidatus Venteria ishoeyi]SEH07822.1 DNA methylase [Candidatus Venteria ishoeyi]
MSYAIQSKTGIEQNKLYRDDTGIHDWYRFVLSYPPHLVRNYINKFQLNARHTILDPFCGTGTTLVESKKLAIPSIGIEANPVVQMAAKAKVNWNIEGDALIEHSLFIAKEVENELKDQGGNLKSLNVEKEKLIINNSISPLPLHKSLVFLEVLNDMIDERFYDIERTAFAKQLVYSYSNLNFGPEVGVSRKKKNDVDVVGLWVKEIQKIATDLSEYASGKDIFSKVYLGDSRNIGRLLDNESIDSIITSPPYPNEKDYTRTTRLESVLLDFMNVKTDLRQNKEGLLRSNTRNIYKGDDDDKWIEKHQHIVELADSIEARRIELGKTSGFERLYHKVVKNYFGGMARHLEDLKPLLRPGAQLAYVVGEQASYFQIPIQTGKLLSDIAVEMGYDLVNIDLFRTRLSTVTKAQLREEVVLLRWKG